MKEMDIKMTMYHNREKILACSTNGEGTLKLTVDDVGVKYSFEAPNTVDGDTALELVKRGWYIGFTGVLTFKNARKALEVAAAIPLERLVLETDCPYMAPEPFRGKRNHPGYLYRMAERLAELRGVPVKEIHRITTENGKRLYNI